MSSLPPDDDDLERARRLLVDDIILAAIQAAAHQHPPMLAIVRQTDSQQFEPSRTRVRATGTRAAGFWRDWFVDETHGGWSLQDHTAPNRDRPAPPPSSPGATTWARARRQPDDSPTGLVLPEQAEDPLLEYATTYLADRDLADRAELEDREHHEDVLDALGGPPDADPPSP